MKQLITLTFVVERERQPEFLSMLNTFKSCWDDAGFQFSVYIEKREAKLIIVHFKSERSFDAITDLIQEEAWAQETFEAIKAVAEHIDINVYQKVI